MDFIKSIHPCYLILNILLGIVLFLYFGEREEFRRYRKICVVIFLVASGLLFSYLNGLVCNIFDLKYLDVKIYLLVVGMVNVIVLFTMNKPVRLGYKICNYILFVLITIIFGSTVAVVLGNKYEQFYLMDVGNAIHFMDLSMVIFMIYLIVISLVFIGYHLSVKKDVVSVKKKSDKKVFSLPKLSMRERKWKIEKKHRKVGSSKEEQGLTLEELLKYDKEEGFYIGGVECGIIFEDSNQENILKNYQILSQDIHARLVNGYTLDENKMLKNICMKLQVNSLSSIDIGNVSLLNKISIDEYNLLRKVFGVN